MKTKDEVVEITYQYDRIIKIRTKSSIIITKMEIQLV